MAQMLPGFRVSQPNLNALFQPLQTGLRDYQRGADRAAIHEANEAQRAQSNALTNARMGLQRERMAQQADFREREFDQRQKNFEARQGLERQRLDDGRRKQRLQQAAGLVQMIQGQQDPAQREEMYQRLLQADPDLGRNVEGLSADQGLNWILARTQGAQGSARYGRTGAVFQDENGSFYTIQFGSDGSRRILPIGEGLAPAKGITTVDTGTGTDSLDKATGGTIRSIDSNIAEAERQKIAGRETAQGQFALPKIKRGMELYERKSLEVEKYIDEAIGLAGQYGTTGFVGGMSKGIPGSPAYRLARKLDPIIANIGFEELQSMRDNSPTGGALGQVAVQELKMLQSVLGSLDQAQSARDVISALNSVRAIRADFREMKRRAYEEDSARFGASSVPNPETGQVENQPSPQAAQTLVFDPASGELRPK